MRIPISKLVDSADPFKTANQVNRNGDAKQTKSSGSAASLDDESMPIDSQVVGDHPIIQTSLFDIVEDKSLTDKQKIYAITERLKNHKSLIFKTDAKGRTLLHAACVNSGVELAQWLIQQDRDLLSAKILPQRTNVLFYAAANANEALVSYFLKLQPKLATEYENDNQTVLHAAAEGGDVKIFQMLLGKLKKPLASEFYGGEPSILVTAASQGHLSFIQWIATNHIEIMASCVNIDNAINKALERENGRNDPVFCYLSSFLGSHDWIHYLFENDLHNEACERGVYPIHYLTINGCIKNVEFLLDKGVDVDQPTFEESRVRPIDLACVYGHLSIIKLLISRGAEFHLPSGEGIHPIQYAIRNGHSDIVAWFISNKVSIHNISLVSLWTSMHFAAESGSLEVVELLYKHKADINKPDKKGLYPIHWAFKFNQFNVAKWLLEHGVSPDQPLEDKEDDDDDDDDENILDYVTQTPLMIALFHGHLGLVDLLSSFKARYTFAKDSSSDNEQVISGEVLLLYAVKFPQTLSIVKNLLDCNVKPDGWLNLRLPNAKKDGANPIIPIRPEEDVSGVTAMHEAVRHNNTDAVRCLLAKENINIMQGDGCFNLTIISENLDIFNLLFTHVLSKFDKYSESFIEQMGGSDDYSHNEYIFKKPFPKVFFDIMRQRLPPHLMEKFVLSYLDNFPSHDCDNFKESTLIAFVNLIKQDFPLLHKFLSRSRAKDTKTILKSVDDKTRHELLRFNDYQVIRQDFGDEEFSTETFYYLVYQLIDEKLRSKFICQYLEYATDHIRILAYQREAIAGYLTKLMEDINSHKRYAIIHSKLNKAQAGLWMERKSQIFNSLLYFVNEYSKRRDCIFLLAPKIILTSETILTWERVIFAKAQGSVSLASTVDPHSYSIDERKCIWDEINFLLALLNDEQDRRAFLALIPLDLDTRKLFDNYIDESGLLARAAAINKICQKSQCKYDTVITCQENAKSLLSLSRTASNPFLQNRFSQLPDAINAKIATFLTGLSAGLTKYIWAAMNKNGIKIAKDKGIIKPKPKEPVPDAKDEKSSTIVKTNTYLRSSTFFQRVSAAIDGDTSVMTPVGGDTARPVGRNPLKKRRMNLNMKS